MSRVTVFTPTYNRADRLDALYRSLLAQTNPNFNWLIVDDGSTDDTEAVVEAYIAAGRIAITYIKQDNGGKHVAHNTAVEHCTTDIFYGVDSDDYISDDCIDFILAKWPGVAADETLAGLVAQKKDIHLGAVMTAMPANVERCSLYDLYYRHGFKGDAAIVFKTQILKQYLFPVFDGETFVTEGAVYDLISDQYDLMLFDRVIYHYEYLSSGYSANIHRVHQRNPRGYMYYLNQKIDLAKDNRAYCQAVVDYMTGMVMIGRNPFKQAPVPTITLVKQMHHVAIRLLKILIKTYVLKRIH